MQNIDIDEVKKISFELSMKLINEEISCNIDRYGNTELIGFIDLYLSQYMEAFIAFMVKEDNQYELRKQSLINAVDHLNSFQKMCLNLKNYSVESFNRFGIENNDETVIKYANQILSKLKNTDNFISKLTNCQNDKDIDDLILNIKKERHEEKISKLTLEDALKKATKRRFI